LIQRNVVLITLFFFCFLFSCSPTYLKHISTYNFQNKTDTPEYNNLDYWAANPDKKSLSDSLPDLLKDSFGKDSSVDVFFLHPTTFDDNSDMRWNADINNDSINTKTDYTTILYQASAFNECRIFAPRYRQAHLRSYFTKDTARALAAFDTAYLDLKNAFQYYLDNYNRGRPIIIASHSQGSTHAQRLLKEFFDGKPLKNKLVAAYVIGMYIPENTFTELPQCKDSLQTGCFVAWRSFKNGYEPPFVKKEKIRCFVTNPLTWTDSNEYAPKDLNLGGVLTKFNKINPHVADAQIHDNILWVHKPHFPGSFFYMTKNYHIGDINLFYMNIRENVHSRIAAYKKKD
jgi:hypothetical protein